MSLVRGVVQGGGGSGERVAVATAETVALVAAMSVPPTAARIRIIDDFIYGLKAAGLWSLIDYMAGWGALHDAQASRINWKNPALVGSVVNTPSFLADVGYTYDGVTSYEDTGFPPSAAVAATATSAFLGVYEGTNVAVTGVAAGVLTTGANQVNIGPRTGPGAARGAVMSNNGVGVASMPDSRGFSAYDRAAGVFNFYKNGALFEAITPATITGSLPAGALWLGGSNTSGVLALPRPANVRGVVFGAHLTAGQHADFYALAQACMTAIGANV